VSTRVAETLLGVGDSGYAEAAEAMTSLGE
jgi:hypothetical protein